jgi:HK97 family phage major capsid protein
MPDMQLDLPRSTAGWMMSQTMRKVVRKVNDADGRPAWTPPCNGEPALLLDYPVFINNDMPDPAADATSLAFGNLRRYMIRDALELQLLRFDDSAFALKGQVGFLAIARAGGNLLDTGAVVLYQHPSS